MTRTIVLISIPQLLWVVVLSALLLESPSILHGAGECPYEDDGYVDYCTYPNSGCAPNFHEENGCCCYDFSPILIDTRGDGFELTSALEGVLFDFTGEGWDVQIAWTTTGTDDAWLVLDRNLNGTIDSAIEMFGNATPQPESDTPNGFLALREFDQPKNGGNGDGVIDAADVIFSSLRIWRDLNHNATSERRELRNLRSAGITGFSLNYLESPRIDEHGNRFVYRGEVFSRTKPPSRGGPAPGVGRWAWDVFLRVAPKESSTGPSAAVAARGE